MHSEHALLWFGPGCSGERMHSEHERYCGLGMDALVSICTRKTNVISPGLGMDALVGVCTQKTNVITVWAWILWFSDALGTRTSLWFGHGCSGYWMYWERERHYSLGMDALVSVCTRNTRYYGLGMDALVSVCTRNTRYFGLGMDVLVSICTRKTNVISAGLGMDALVGVRRKRTLLGFAHGYYGERLHSEHERYNMAWTWMLWFWDALGKRTILWYGHGCPGFRMHSDDERYHGLGMDRLVIGCTRNTTVIMFWAWMLWLLHPLGTRTLLWFGTVCSGYPTALEHRKTRCVVYAVHIWGPRNTSNAWSVGPGWPHPKRSAKYADTL